MKSVLSLLIWTLGLSVPAGAVTIASEGATEASYACSGGRCLAQAPKSNLMRMCEDMKARAAWAKDWQCLNAGIFDNGTSPERIIDLRKRPYTSLTDEEKAILRAADKVGNIRFCKGIAGNAFLIQYQGRPAIVTAGHMLVDFKTGKLKCSSEDLKDMTYFPNSSYYNAYDPSENKSFVLREVPLEYPPVNLENVMNIKGNSNNNDDYLVFFLKEDVTQDKMPQGHKRSYLQFSKNAQSKGQGLYMLGIGADPGQNIIAPIYQKGCNFHRDYGKLNHDCATINGSSGSLLGHMEDGEIVFSGVHRYALIGNANMPGPSEGFSNMWNVATPSQYIEDKQ